MRRKSSITSWIIAVSTAIAMLSLTAWGLSGAYANMRAAEATHAIEAAMEAAAQEYTQAIRREFR